MSKKTIDDLRAVLFEALAEAKDKSTPLDVQRMRAISDIAAKITDTARVEVDFLRQAGSKSGSGFITAASVEDHHVDHAKTPPALELQTTQHGTVSVQPVAGGNILTHRMR